MIVLDRNQAVYACLMTLFCGLAIGFAVGFAVNLSEPDVDELVFRSKMDDVTTKNWVKLGKIQRLLEANNGMPVINNNNPEYVYISKGDGVLDVVVQEGKKKKKKGRKNNKKRKE